MQTITQPLLQIKGLDMYTNYLINNENLLILTRLEIQIFSRNIATGSVSVYE